MEQITNNLQETDSIVVNNIPQERASFGDRFFAALVDNIILNIPLRILFFFMFIFSANTSNLYVAAVVALLIMLISLSANLGYFAVFAQRRNGQTLGKKWNKVKVVDLQGKDLTLQHFLKREFYARGIPILGVILIGNFANIWLLTYLLALTEEKRALHDKLAGTQVIKLR